VPDEPGNDGKHVSYLNGIRPRDRRLRECDPELFRALGEIVAKRRDVAAIRRRGILPPDTAFFERQLKYSSVAGSTIELRQRHRNQWLREAVDQTAGCDIIFVDPDNGLECGVHPYAPKGPKYVFYNELRDYLRLNHTVVIYHHLSRQGKHLSQIEWHRSKLMERLRVTGDILALRYRRGTARAYFILPAERHRSIIHQRIKGLVDGPWGYEKRFELVPGGVSAQHGL